ncbi:MAG: SRPBCC domain-containing protein [Proteobacteria bacterium]|nr:SRPBCC domain-containing protein [Pseudomonadota bacterium]
MTALPTLHTDFVIEREFAATPAEVFAAWADPGARMAWSNCHPGNTRGHRLDFRIGGHEVYEATTENGDIERVDRFFFDIVDGHRIVFGYDISFGGKRLSVSLVTIEFFPTKRGTRMVYTEQLAYLDGHEDRAERRRGTEEGFDRLARMLDMKKD